MNLIALFLVALLLQPSLLTLTSSASNATIQQGGQVTIMIIVDTTEEVTITQPIDQARFTVEAIDPEPSDHLGQLGHVDHVRVTATGPVTLSITLRVLDDAPAGLVTLTTTAFTSEKIAVQASTAVRVGYVSFVPIVIR